MKPRWGFRTGLTDERRARRKKSPGRILRAAALNVL